MGPWPQEFLLLPLGKIASPLCHRHGSVEKGPRESLGYVLTSGWPESWSSLTSGSALQILV